jgi:hypothetical protein
MADMHPISKAEIDAVAALISEGPLGLAWHKPEEGADAYRCFENAARKVEKAGGTVMFGWTFHHRVVVEIPGPGYLFSSHHAVWRAPSGSLVDVTPHPDGRHKPLGPDGSIIFLVDRDARPVVTGNQMAPLPMRFFARDNDPRLLAYVEELNRREEATCREIYEAGESEGQ